MESSATSSSSPIGVEVIRKALETMPTSPGVYRMLDAGGKALYVGKAKNLKNRVSNYTQLPNLGLRIRRMVAQTASMEMVVTRSEAEALLVEANLIKSLMPRYNILLRDDKSFPYIFLSGDHRYPRIAKHRGAQTRKGEYYGPFASAGAVNETLATLQKAFLLRPCADTVFQNRSRPCLQYQIKRCTAPCVELVTPVDYAKQVDQARLFLTGKSREVQDSLTQEMIAASEAMDYERAAQLRDRLKALTRIQNEQGIYTAALKEADVIGLHRDTAGSAIQVMFFRNGQTYGNKTLFPSHDDTATEGEILEAFLGQFYQGHTPPPLILLSHLPDGREVLEEALCLRLGKKVSLQVPQKGDKREIIAQAMQGAAQAFKRRLAEHASQNQLLDGVARLFGLAAAPERIEVYDNSHIMGTNAIGAMIVAGREGFLKKEYRKFNFKDARTTPGDDYAMMREMLTRRFRRIAEEQQEGDDSSTPDLMLIDGGPGQLSATLSAMEEIGIPYGSQGVTVVAIAKGPNRNAGRETFFMPEREPFQLPVDDAVLHYLQRLRDEAHRFAIGSHRQKRSKALITSELDGIPGIGPSRKKALLMHFGSARAVGQATLQDLEKVQGVNASIARLIYEYFHSA
jgi:excinuclease ABC subunit C